MAFYNNQIGAKAKMANTNTGALAAIDELRIDSKIGKSKHFNASDRKMFWHRFYGVPVIIANLFVGIVLVSLQGTSPPLLTPLEKPSKASVSTTPLNSTIAIDDQGTSVISKNTDRMQETPSAEPHHSIPNGWLGIFSIFLAFGAASLSGIQTFFNFHKASEGHRAIGNRYVHISRQCKGLQQKHLDVPYSSADLWTEYDKLYSDYHQINTEAEAFPTSPKDLQKARSASEISPYKAPETQS
ncbi:SLATT domain-containing protein [Collimonas fungivorans]|uniref:SLATT domain-containing protein n=1 Tax=Collimonas fungivorans TaxID=158899 RepID=UPI001969CE66|nr:SLATT domain-containing protein [Collimonas fungivorans]